MRILQALPRYAPAWSFGGGVRMFWLLATELAERGHEITVATSDAIGPAERATERVERLHRRIVVTRFPNRRPRLSTMMTPLFFRPQGMREGLVKLAESADIVHMGESRGIHNMWAADAAARAGVPLAWSAYGGLATSPGVRGVYRRVHDLAFTRRVVPRVSLFIAQTGHEEKVYLAHGADPLRIRQIPLCVDGESLNGVPGRGALRRRLGVPDDSGLVVCVARLSPVKGIDTLIRSFARIRLARPPYLAVVGWDHGALKSLRSLVRALGIEDRVRFCGPLYGRERLQAYVDADIFALTPRVYEETSLAALEAAACGTATVVTPECEIPGLEAAGGGVVVRKREEDISQELTSLLEDAQRRAEMGRAARQFIAVRFSAGQVAARHEEVFAEMIR
jgi:glycosyltransferase involved in cell wall biosynthesis